MTITPTSAGTKRTGRRNHRPTRGIVGQNRAKVNVSAHMRFDHQTIKEELIDPDQTSVVSEQTVDESSTGSRSIPVGPAE